jgi:uncharacterized membrane protein YecN with MAPEG domain
MPTALPFVAAAYAALFGLISTVLTARVIMNRVRSGIQAGDGGDAALARAIRARANFAEQVPLALLLLVPRRRPGRPARRSCTPSAPRS